jgi:hypothetical protein
VGGTSSRQQVSDFFLVNLEIRQFHLGIAIALVLHVLKQVDARPGDDPIIVLQDNTAAVVIIVGDK